MSILETVSPKAIAFVFAASCGTIGGFIGYAIAKRKYEELADHDIAEAKAYYADKFKEVTDGDEMLTYKAAAARYSGEEVSEALAERQFQLEEGAMLSGDEAEQVARTIEIGEEIKSGWDWDYENAHRDVTLPHIIHVEEFNQNNLNHNQVEMTWYEVDEVLVDENGSMPLDAYRYIGVDNVRFGHGSGDDNIVYIRNVDVEIDIVLVRNTGSFATQVLGIQP